MPEEGPVGTRPLHPELPVPVGVLLGTKGQDRSDRFHSFWRQEFRTDLLLIVLGPFFRQISQLNTI